MCREARKAALQATLAEKEASEKAGHNYKANPVPDHTHNPGLPALPEPSFTVSTQDCVDTAGSCLTIHPL